MGIYSSIIARIEAGHLDDPGQPAGDQPTRSRHMCLDPIFAHTDPWVMGEGPSASGHVVLICAATAAYINLGGTCYICAGLPLLAE